MFEDYVVIVKFTLKRILKISKHALLISRGYLKQMVERPSKKLNSIKTEKRLENRKRESARNF